MADTSPVPGALKRSEVLRQVEDHKPHKQVSPTLQAFVLGFIGAALIFVSGCFVLNGMGLLHW